MLNNYSSKFFESRVVFMGMDFRAMAEGRVKDEIQKQKERGNERQENPDRHRDATPKVEARMKKATATLESVGAPRGRVETLSRQTLDRMKDLEKLSELDKQAAREYSDDNRQTITLKSSMELPIFDSLTDRNSSSGKASLTTLNAAKISHSDGSYTYFYAPDQGDGWIRVPNSAIKSRK